MAEYRNSICFLPANSATHLSEGRIGHRTIFTTEATNIYNQFGLTHLLREMKTAIFAYFLPFFPDAFIPLGACKFFSIHRSQACKQTHFPKAICHTIREKSASISMTRTLSIVKVINEPRWEVKAKNLCSFCEAFVYGAGAVIKQAPFFMSRSNFGRLCLTIAMHNVILINNYFKKNHFLQYYNDIL